jgi:hypothetical protein
MAFPGGLSLSEHVCSGASGLHVGVAGCYCPNADVSPKLLAVRGDHYLSRRDDYKS